MVFEPKTAMPPERFHTLRGHCCLPQMCAVM